MAEHTPLHAEAIRAAASWAAGQPHDLKVTEDKAACRALDRPICALYVRLQGAKRGRHVACLLGDAIYPTAKEARHGF